MKFLALLPLVFLVFLSGCSFWPFGGGGTTVEEPNILVVSDVQAPKTVEGGTPVTITAYIENKADKKLDGAKVELFGLCSGSLVDDKDTDVKVDCEGNGALISGTSCTLNFFAKQQKKVQWTLDTVKVPVQQTCKPQVQVIYPFTTISATTITFISSQEASVDPDNHFKTTITLGEGPVKAYLDVDPKNHPIITASQSATPGTKSLNLIIKNLGVGSLYPSPNEIERANTEVTFEQGGRTLITLKPDECDIEETTGTLKLDPKKKDYSEVCKIDQPKDDALTGERKVPISSIVTVEYEYDVRSKEIPITITSPPS